MLTLKKSFFRIPFYAVLVGVLAGFASAIFLTLLELATKNRDQHPFIISFLPLAGWGIGWSYRKFDKHHHLIKKINLVLFGTIATHLFGGSAGREGTAVQMAKLLAEQTARWLKLNSEDRRILLIAGAGAGFGSAVGAPWAGVFFGLEKNQFRETPIQAWIQCLIASWTASWTSHFVGAPHSIYPAPYFFNLSLVGFFSVGLCSVFFGLLAIFFTKTVFYLEHFFRNIIQLAPLRPFLGGLILVGLYFWEGSYRYVGLGIPIIQESLHQVASFRDVFFKFVFTALTLASGFKGGEFVPLVFMGTALGSAFSQWLPLPAGVLGAVGFSAVFGAVSRTPFTCAILATELFGVSMAPYALTGCWISAYCSGFNPLKLLKFGTPPTA